MANDELPVSRRKLLRAGAALGALPLTLSTVQDAAAGGLRRTGHTAPSGRTDPSPGMAGGTATVTSSRLLDVWA